MASPFNEKPFDPEPQRERIRALVALFLTAFFALLVCFYLVASFYIRDAASWTQVKDAFQVVFPATSGVLGTAIAFFFGKERH